MVIYILEIGRGEVDEGEHGPGGGEDELVDFEAHAEEGQDFVHGGGPGLGFGVAGDEDEVNLVEVGGAILLDVGTLDFVEEVLDGVPVADEVFVLGVDELALLDEELGGIGGEGLTLWICCRK